MIPNFLILGDVKAGTSSLYSYLRQHPQIFMPAMKEPRFFAFDAENPFHRRSAAYPIRTTEAYMALFASADAKAVGEASPSYLRSPTAARRIKAALPHARLIVCLRHPVERLHSEYLMDYREQRITQPFDEAVFTREALWIKGRFYAPDLKRYYDLFPSEQIRVVLFDDLKRDALDTTQDLFRFLGVDDSFVPSLAIENEGGAPRNLAAYSLFSTAKNLVRPLVPMRFRSLGLRMERSLLHKPALDPTLSAKILEVCAEDIRQTAELTGLDLSRWI